MTEIGCETARERIPHWVGGRLPAAEAAELSSHAEVCAECRAEAELARLLHSARPLAPAALADDIRAVVRYRRSTVPRPWWGIVAAGVASLALGIGVSSNTLGEDVEVPEYAAASESAALWVSDDGLIAGDPALEDLSEEALLTLLEELGSGGPG